MLIHNYKSVRTYKQDNHFKILDCLLIFNSFIRNEKIISVNLFCCQRVKKPKWIKKTMYVCAIHFSINCQNMDIITIFHTYICKYIILLLSIFNLYLITNFLLHLFTAVELPETEDHVAELWTWVSSSVHNVQHVVQLLHS